MRLFVCALAFAALPLLAACGSSSPTTPSTSAGTFTETDLVVGTGAEATTGKSITVDYTGWLYDTSKPDGKGAQFDTSIGRVPFPVTPLGGGIVIKGWDQGDRGHEGGRDAAADHSARARIWTRRPAPDDPAERDARIRHHAAQRAVRP